MPRGGRRPGTGGKQPGAGRPKGVPNKASAARAATVQSTGSTPLDVMIETMRYFRGMAAKHQETDEQKCAEYLKMAATVAKDAGPYVHQKLSAVDASLGGQRDLSKLTDAELDALERISRKIAGTYGNTSGED